jgi:hypothetical protein
MPPLIVQVLLAHSELGVLNLLRGEAGHIYIYRPADRMVINDSLLILKTFIENSANTITCHLISIFNFFAFL